MKRTTVSARTVLLGACATVLALASGCASLRERMGGRPKYPTYTSYASRPAMIAPAPAATSPRASPRTAPATVAPAPKIQPQVALPAAPRIEPPQPVAPTLKVPAPATTARAPGSTPDLLKVGDPIIVYLRGIPGYQGGQQTIEAVINEKGQINLPYINAVQAAGRTATELEDVIQHAYLDQQIYKYISVNILVPSRFYYVRGEVRGGGRFPLIGKVTVMQAIAAAGGFSEFADASRVEVLRGNDRIRINVRDLEKHPEKDREVEPGDVIIIRRSFF